MDFYYFLLFYYLESLLHSFEVLSCAVLWMAYYLAAALLTLPYNIYHIMYHQARLTSSRSFWFISLTAASVYCFFYVSNILYLFKLMFHQFSCQWSIVLFFNDYSYCLLNFLNTKYRYINLILLFYSFLRFPISVKCHNFHFE